MEFHQSGHHLDQLCVLISDTLGPVVITATHLDSIQCQFAKSLYFCFILLHYGGGGGGGGILLQWEVNVILFVLGGFIHISYRLPVGVPVA